MNKKIIFKLIVDLLMAIAFLFLMAFRFTEGYLHEIIGASVFVLFITHAILNRKWYLSLFRGKYNAMRTFKTTINILILLLMLIIIVNAIFISQHLFSFIPLDSTLFVIELHMFCAAWIFVLVSIHLGLHWKMILNITKFSAKNKTLIVLSRIGVIVLSYFGIKAFIARYLFQKLMMYPAYDSISLSGTGLEILNDYLLIMITIVSITYYSLIILKKKNTNT
ncbi:hypothetical protein [Prevotella sp.]|uniref:hypothetical protein n=1 Tax=Prevotella sp. TaxID=59823 RepID=UPI003DA308A6